MHFFEIKDAKDVKKDIKDLIEPDNEDSYEDMLKSKVKEYFYSKDFNEEYLEIKLRDWISVYSAFEKLANSIDLIHKEFTLSELKIALDIKGIEEKKLDKIIKFFTFNKNSKDIFDSFLIKKNDDFIFTPKIFNFIDASRSMISLFGKNNEKKASGINQKGTGFENEIFNLIQNKIPKAVKNLKCRSAGEDYEIDIVFELDNNLFFCECKTQFQHENAREFFRNKMELQTYLEKFKRGFEFFINNPVGINEIETKLGIENISNYQKCYKIFISNIAYSECKIDDIFITDDAKIYRYFNRIPAFIHSINPKAKKVVQLSLFGDFYKGDINIDQFRSYLYNKDKEIEIDKIKIQLYENKSMSNYGINSERYISRNMNEEDFRSLLKTGTITEVKNDTAL